MNNSKQKCVTHAQATFSRLQVMEYKEIEGSTYGGWKTPTLGDWLELLEKEHHVGFSMRVNNEQELCCYFSFPDDNPLKFNLATNEPATEKDWDTLAELLNL